MTLTDSRSTESASGRQPLAAPGLPRWLMDLDVVMLRRIAEVSPRLHSFLNGCGLKVGDYVRDPLSVTEAMRFWPNVGAKARRDFVSLLETVLANGAPPDPAKPFDWRTSDVSHGFERVRGMIFGAPEDPVADLVQRLDGLGERAREVLFHRFGAFGRQRMSLEEIAKVQGCTRERIRQIESRAIRVLSSDSARRVCAAVVELGGAAAWAALARGRPTVPFAGIGLLSRQVVDPVFQVAATVSHGGVRQWLDSRFERTQSAWVEDRSDADASNAVIAALGAERELPVPQALSRISSVFGFPPAQIERALRHSDDFAVFDGYLVRRPLAAVRRSARFHAIALSRPDPVFDCKSVFLAYRDRHPEDDFRMSQSGAKSLDECPHLFLRLYDGIYVALGHGCRAIPLSPSLPFDHCTDLVDEPGSGDGLRAWMESVLFERGPMALSDLAQLGVARFGDGFNMTNVWATSHMFRCFRRELPGVVGFGERRPDWSDEHFRAQAFKPSLVRLYLASRRAGEVGRLFPLWDGAYERRMCEWLRSEPSRDALFWSAMCVADLSSWDLDGSDLAAWDRVRRSGRPWQLPSADDGSAFSAKLAPIDLAKAAFHLSKVGAMSIVSANRIIGASLSRAHGLGLMALLCASGMAVSGDDPSDGIRPGPLLDEIRMELEAELCDRGWISWASGAAGDVLDAAAMAEPAQGSGWLSGPRVQALVARLRR